jgi:hypothetical protein
VALTNAMPSGTPSRGAVPAAKVMVPLTVLVAGLMTVTLPDSTLPTHTCEPSGHDAHAAGQ